MGRSKSPLAAVAVLLLAAGTGRAEPYHNTEYHFNLDLPTGWEVLTADELKLANTWVHDTMPGMDVTMVVGFRPAKGNLSRTGFVLVQLDKRVTDKTSFEDLERDMLNDYAAAARGEPEAMLRQIRRLIFAKPEFDRDRKRYTVRGPINGGVRQCYGASTGQLGPDGLLILHAFTRTGGARSELDPFIKVSDSFRLDELEKSEPNPLDRLFGDQVGPDGRMAIVGVAVTLLVAVIGALALREKPRHSWSNGRPYID